MSFQRGVAQVLRITCYDGETPTDPASGYAVERWTGAAWVAVTGTPTIIPDGIVSVTLTGAETDTDAITVRVTSSNLEPQVAHYYPESDWTATRAGRLDKLNVSGTLAHTDNAATFKATGFATAGDAMTLTSGERSSIASAVWNAATRTLTGFGTLVADIWSALTRTITGGNVDTVDGQTLAHLDADISSRATAADVWGHETRSLTEAIATEISANDRALIANAVADLLRWRLLISDRTLIVDAPDRIADGRGNLRVVRDDDVVLPFVWTGTDLTGYTVYMTVRPDTGSDADPTDATATFQVTADITDAGAGKFEFQIGRAQTGACRTDVEYWYDVQAISPSGDITTLIIATLSVIGDVTRRTG